MIGRSACSSAALKVPFWYFSRYSAVIPGLFGLSNHSCDRNRLRARVSAISSILLLVPNTSGGVRAAARTGGWPPAKFSRKFGVLDFSAKNLHHPFAASAAMSRPLIAPTRSVIDGTKSPPCPDASAAAKYCLAAEAMIVVSPAASAIAPT